MENELVPASASRGLALQPVPDRESAGDGCSFKLRKTTTWSIRFINSARIPRAARQPSDKSYDLLRYRGSLRALCRGKPMPPGISSDISRAPRLDVRITIVREKSTRRLSPGSGRLSRIPRSIATGRSDAFSIHRRGQARAWVFRKKTIQISCVSIGDVSVDEVSRRRADQFAISCEC